MRGCAVDCEQLDRTLVSVSCLRGGYSIGSAVAQVLWSGFLDPWARYSAVGSVLVLVGQQNGIQGLHGLEFGKSIY